MVRMVTMKLGKRSAAAKRNGGPENFDEYIARTPEPGRSRLAAMRAAIRSVMPAEAVEVISYKIPAFRLNRVLVWFAAFSDYCSLFPSSAVIAAFKNELKGYSTSKGTVHFPMDKPLPIALIKKIVKARVVQNERKKPHA
jgi:uncharacterized protein YdhG (YjbR/CyaY superfamily)